MKLSLDHNLSFSPRSESNNRNVSDDDAGGDLAGLDALLGKLSLSGSDDE